VDRVLEAENADEAEAVAAAEEIDILLTDIRLPGMSGLDLVQRLRDEGRDLSVIIITGYSEFDYAHASVKLQVDDYILKPVRATKIADSVRRALRRRQERRQKDQRLEELRQQIEENREALRDKLFQDILGSYTAEEISSTLEYLGLSEFFQRPVTVAVCHLDFGAPGEGGRQSDRYLISNLCLYDGLEARLQASGLDYRLLNYRMNRLVVFVSGNAGYFTGIAQEFLEAGDCGNGVGITIGVGTAYRGVEGCLISYREATRAAKLSYLYGSGRLFFYRDVQQEHESRGEHIAVLQKSTIEDDLRVGNFHRIRHQVRRIFDSFREHSLDIDSISAICNSLMLQSARTLAELGHSVFAIMGSDFDLFLNAEEFSSLDELRLEIERFYEKVSSWIEQSRDRRNSELVSQIKGYVDERYRESISLGDLSRRFHLSTSYISLLFNKHLGQNFSDYVTSRRIETAKEQLTHTDRRIYEIAEQVGYSDAYYFSTCFKRVTGLSPSQFREQLQPETP
jgi:two-component system response regulator YesN